MATIDPVVVKIQADVSDLKAGLTRAEASLKGLDDNVKKAGSTFNGFGNSMKTLGKVLGTVFAATQVVSFFKESIQQANEAQAAQVRLASLLRNTAGATEEQIAALEKQAEALSKVGIASKDNITITQSQLATFDLQGKTINTLTPAILDYVAAEKGATATSDDYKQMTNGLAQALQGNFAALTRVGFVLDEDTKKKISNGTEAQRAAAITEVLNSTYKDFNKTIAQTPEGRMIKLKQEFDDLKQTLGEALLPVLQSIMGFLNTTVMPTLKKAAEFVKTLTTNFGGSGGLSENIKKVKDEIVAFFKPFLDLTKNVAGPDSLSERLRALGENIKGFIVPIFNAFRNALYTVRKAILDNRERIENLLGMFKEIFNWVNKYIVPLFRTVIVVALQQAGKAIAATLKFIIPVVEFVVTSIKGLMNLAIKGINLLIKGYNFAAKLLGKEQIPLLDEVGKKTEDFSVKMGKVGTAAKNAGKDIKEAFKDPFAGDTGSGKTGGGGKGDKDTEKKLDALKKKLKDYYKDWADLQTEANEKVAEAQERYSKRVNDAYAAFAERKADLQERYNEQMAEAQERYDESIADAKDRRQKAEQAATKKHTETLLTINIEYRKRIEELEKTRDAKILDLQRTAQKKREDIVAAGQEKLLDIISKSRDRLRDAWKKGTEFSLADLFGGAKEGGKSLIDTLKEQLTSVRNFQKSAGELAGQGYTQTFIEQIVAAGPKAGMDMINQLKKLSPEQQKEVQNMYMALEDLSTSGMDAIANTLSTSTSFATDELANMYAQTQQDIASALSKINEDLTTNIAEAKTNYEEALTEAGKIRNEKLAEADKALIEALAESTLAYNEALEDATKTLAKAQENAKKTLDKGLIDAQKTLDKALLEAQQSFEKSIDEINKSMQKKLNDLIEKIKEAQNAIRAIQPSSTFAALPSYTSFSTTPTPVAPTTSVAPVTNNNVSVTAVTQADSKTIADDVISAIKYGQTVVTSKSTTGSVARGEYSESVAAKAPVVPHGVYGLSRKARPD